MKLIKKFKSGTINIVSPYYMPKTSIYAELYCNNIDALYNNEINLTSNIISITIKKYQTKQSNNISINFKGD